jgi:DNA-directed RNA polymerase specialized sigma24 family protein
MQLPMRAPLASLAAVQPLECEAPCGIADAEEARLDRLTGDADLVDRLMWAGYAGPEWDRFREALAAYGFVVCRAWIGNGQIFAECAKKKIRGPRRDARLPSYAEDVAIETVVATLPYFREFVLIPRVWDPTRGASLKTFFVGACVLHFRNAYRTWSRQQRRFGAFHDTDAAILADDRCSSRPDSALSIEWILRAVRDPEVRQIGQYIAEGYTQDEIAELQGTTVDAIRSRLERYRNKHNGRR